MRAKAPPQGKSSYGGGIGADFGDSFIRFSSFGGYGGESAARNSTIVASVASWAMRNVVQPYPAAAIMEADGETKDRSHPCAMLVANPQRSVREEDRARLSYRKMLRLIAWSLIFDGNAYLAKVRGPRGVIGLDWHPHTSVKPVLRKGNGGIVDAYEFRNGATTQRVAPSEVVHVTSGVDPESAAMGCSPLKAAMRMVMTDVQIGVYSHAILTNPFPGIIVTPTESNEFQPEDVKTILEQLKNVASGEKGGGAAAFSQDLNVKTLGFSPDDLAVKELARLPEERITAVFGIPAIVCGMGAGLERSTFANFEQAREAATEEFLVPLWDEIADVLTSQLLPDFDASENVRLVLDYSGVKALQEDTDELHVRAREDFKANVIDRATSKRMIGLEPGKEDEGVYSYMLKPAAPTAPVELPDGKRKANARRLKEEDAA